MVGRWSLQDAKNSFSRVVDAALGGVPQTVTKRGRPAVVVLSVAEYERLNQRQAPEAPSFIDHLLAMPRDGCAFERAPVRPRDVDL
ncbi:MAG: type II toxin-antitoxin system Phd/YefM family antitoxin [Magnetospirillum sp.]|nr:type II toxin-antitoxin system Phd/YefM family antitoxin [Magnetospirillum sp.]